MFKYRDGTLVKDGDRVLVSQRWADEHASGNRKATVVSRRGFVTVRFDENGTQIDVDMRSVRKQIAGEGE